MDHVEQIARELDLARESVQAVLDLLKEGGTVPFIARYRKERTRSMDEVKIRSVQERAEYLEELEARKKTVAASIEAAGKLDQELKSRLERALTKAEVEDLYLPFKPRKTTRASTAREKGLEPLAERIWVAVGPGAPREPAKEAAKDAGQEAGNEAAKLDPAEVVAPFVDPAKEILNADQAWAGARDILAERISEDAALRALVRKITSDEGKVVCKVTEEKAGEKSKFEHYYDHAEAIRTIPSHRYLAIRRGEREGYLSVTIQAPAEKIVARVTARVVKQPASPLARELEKATADGYQRLIAPSIENEVREALKESSDQAAVEVFAVNVHNLLLASPLGAKTVIGLDPGFRTGVKVAVIDKTGKLLEHITIHPFKKRREQGKEHGQEHGKEKEGENGKAPEAPPAPAEESAPPAEAAAEAAPDAAPDAPPEEAAPSAPGVEPIKLGESDPAAEARLLLAALVQKHDVEAIAIGNGTAGRETEAFVDAFVKEWVEAAGRKIVKVMVSEAGASVYSASDVAREEFPSLDVSLRGAISIGRRLQDPLAELVKIDPRSIGVGQYQHDVHQGMLKKKLSEVVESCVNQVGVEANTASKSLLSYVAGIGPSLAKRIVEYRQKNGPFPSREALKKVPHLGEKSFEQAAGFLRVRESENPLDRSAVHPEAYPVVEKMATDLGVPSRELVGNTELAAKLDPAKYVDEKLGPESLKDILEELKKPGRDPRGDFSGPAFRSDVTSVKDLKEGMVLEGVITNVTNFGAFVDVGVHQDGLVHVSELSHHYVKDPTEVVKVGERVQVKVLGVAGNRKRISLSIKATQPAPPVPERAPRPPRPARERRPRDGQRADGPRGDRRPRRRPDGAAPAAAREGAAPAPSPGKAPSGPRPTGPRPPRPGFAPRAPKKVGTHGRKEMPTNDRGIMGKDRGPRERLPRQKGPDTSLGALFGDLLLKKTPDKGQA